MNLPNKLTMLRILMIPIFVVFAVMKLQWAQYVALLIYILACLTDFADGKIESFFSESGSLTSGKTYLLDENGNVSSTEKTLESGMVNGIAGNVITIGTQSFTLASNAIISQIESSTNGHTVKSLSASELYGLTVSYVTSGNTVTHIITIS